MIEYLKSSLSISSYSGCSMGCKYCILSSFEEHSRVKKICDEEDLINNMMNNKFFIPNITPITVNNRTDPFLNSEVKSSTFKILNIIEKRNLKNPVIVITKCYLDTSDISLLSTLKLKLFIIYSYSGLGKPIEFNDKNKALDTIKKLHKLENIKLMHYWRPIIEGINDDEKTLNEIATIANDYFLCSIVSGIRINKFVQQNFDENHIITSIESDVEHKKLNDSSYQKIVAIFKEMNSKYIIFRNTSCAISWQMNTFDYNGNYYKHRYCDECVNSSNCVNKRTEATEFEIKKILDNIGFNKTFTVNRDLISISSELTQEELAYLRHNTGKMVKCSNVIKSKSEKILSV